jgi:predicted transcriptional regulator
MAGRLKIDWKAARIQYESGGFSCYRIAKEHGVSRQAVNAQRRRHRWTRIEDESGNIETLPMLPKSGNYLSLSNNHKFTPELAEALLNGAGAGYPNSLVSQYVGITPKTLKSYLDGSETFRADYMQKRAQFHARQVDRIDAAGERDFRASLELLKAGKVDGFGADSKDSAGVTGSINISREPLPEESTIIDITPDSSI